MQFHQTIIKLRSRPRGFHLVTSEILAAIPELSQFRIGFLHLFLQHTSASLTLNENASPDVRRDFRTWFDAAVPEQFAWTHTLEGDDDMPAHVRSVLTQTSIGVPIAAGRLALGTWQGLYVWEHRKAPHDRRVTVSVIGE